MRIYYRKGPKFIVSKYCLAQFPMPFDPNSNMIDSSRLEQAHGSQEKTYQALSMGAGKRIPPPLSDSIRYVVEFDGLEDPVHPLNWTLGTK
jgi:hypothetical protein